MDAVPGTQRIGTGEPLNGRADRDGAGADDKFVVGQELLVAVMGDEELAARHVDAAGGGVEAKIHAGRLEVADGPVGQIAPMGHLP